MRYSYRFREILTKFLAPATLFPPSHSWTYRVLLSSHMSTSSLKERSGWRRSSGGKKQKQHPYREARSFPRISPAPRHRAAHLAGLSGNAPGNLFVSLVASFCMHIVSMNLSVFFRKVRTSRKFKYQGSQLASTRSSQPPEFFLDPWPHANSLGGAAHPRHSYGQHSTVTQITHGYIEEPTCTNFVPSPVLTCTNFEGL